jgi:branched-chain amino acid transport system ATP-binding protein
MANILSVQDVRKSFGNLHALDGVSLDIAESKISILIGPNGSGKTTLINVISGLYKPDAGKIIFQGKDSTGLAPYELYKTGLARTFQIPALFWKLTVLENLLVAEKKNPGESFLRSLLIAGLKSRRDFFKPWRDTTAGWQIIRGLTTLKELTKNKTLAKRLFRRRAIIRFSKSLFGASLKPWREFVTFAWREDEKQAAQKAGRILELLGMSRFWNQPAYLLSGGQMKLLEIGRALMSEAKLLLLDEPVSGVNPTLAHEIFSRILKLRDELGLTFFIVEHRLDIALRYVDQMFAMALGQLIASGRPEEVMKNTRVIEAYLGG